MHFNLPKFWRNKSCTKIERELVITEKLKEWAKGDMATFSTYFWISRQTVRLAISLAVHTTTKYNPADFMDIIAVEPDTLVTSWKWWNRVQSDNTTSQAERLGSTNAGLFFSHFEPAQNGSCLTSIQSTKIHMDRTKIHTGASQPYEHKFKLVNTGSLHMRISTTF